MKRRGLINKHVCKNKFQISPLRQKNVNFHFYHYIKNNYMEGTNWSFGPIRVCSNGDPRLNLTYLATMSNYVAYVASPLGLYYFAFIQKGKESQNCFL